jgi:hypothetical protein
LLGERLAVAGSKDDGVQMIIRAARSLADDA